MEKRISYSQFQSVKCVAKACDPLISKRNTIKSKIEKLAAEYKDCDTQIKSLEAGIVSVMGIHVEDLVKKVIEPGVDANGKPKKTTKYLPTDIVSYDEQHKQYVITLPDVEANDTTEAVEETTSQEVEAPTVEEGSAEETTESHMVETPISVPETSTESIFE